MKQISNKKFGQFLVELRKEKEMTQKELAEKLFVSDKTVSKWECGNGMPNIALLAPIADVFDISVAELLQGEKIESNEKLATSSAEPLDVSLQNAIHKRKKKWKKDREELLLKKHVLNIPIMQSKSQWN